MTTQFGRFLVAGVGVTLLDFALYALLIHAGFGVILANYCSTIVALIVSFFINKQFTFRSQDTRRVRQFVRFVVVSLIGIWVIQPVLIWLCMPLTLPLFSDNTLAALAAKVVATGGSMIWNYVLYKTVVFNEESRA